MRRQAGFTLLELLIALAVFGLVALGLAGVLVLGARSAGSGERVAEQARRYRIANEVISRQISAAELVQLPSQDEEGLGEEDEEGSSSEPFFFGDAETVEFVTASPQRPDASGMAIVTYWVEDGTLRMKERPMFSAYKGGKLDREESDDSVATILLYDVESVTFSYQRESDSDEWLEEWDGRDEDQLPACVRIDVRPSAIGGPDFYHEIPLMIGLFNQIADTDDDLMTRRVRQSTSDEDGTGAGGGKTKTNTPAPNDDDNDDDDDDDDDDSPGDTLSDPDDEE